jgi:lipoate-protein ligase A
VQPGDAPTLYWSMADRPGVVLGFSQKIAVLNQAALAAESLEVYQRRAGGTVVLVGPHLLDLDVLLPAGHPLILPDVVESYRWFGEAWVETLSTFGISARTVSPDEAHAQRALLKQPETREHESLMQRACYGTLSSYEIAVGQRKLVGLDMLRRRTGTLLQAGLLLQWETETLARLLGQTAEEQEQLREGLLERAIGIEHVSERVIEPREIIAAFERVIFDL